MGTRPSRRDRLSPSRKSKIAHTKSLDRALKDIIKQSERSSSDLYMDEGRGKRFPPLLSRRPTVYGDFSSDDLMCRTYVVGLELPRCWADHILG